MRVSLLAVATATALLTTPALAQSINDATELDPVVVTATRNPDDALLVVCNFTPVVRTGYRIGVPEAGRYREILNTDAEHYGGSGVSSPEPLEAQPIEHHGRPASLELKLPPLAAVMLSRSG